MSPTEIATTLAALEQQRLVLTRIVKVTTAAVTVMSVLAFAVAA